MNCLNKQSTNPGDSLYGAVNLALQSLAGQTAEEPNTAETTADSKRSRTHSTLILPSFDHEFKPFHWAKDLADGCTWMRMM
jgi:hypothetical protein